MQKETVGGPHVEIGAHSHQQPILVPRSLSTKPLGGKRAAMLTRTKVKTRGTKTRGKERGRRRRITNLENIEILSIDKFIGVVP